MREQILFVTQPGPESVSKMAGYNLNDVKKSLFQFLADLDFNFVPYQSFLSDLYKLGIHYPFIE